MAIFEKDGAPVTLKKTDHYTDEHGRWCAELAEKGLLHTVHQHCAERFITGSIHRDRRGRPILPRGTSVAKKKESAVV